MQEVSFIFPLAGCSIYDGFYPNLGPWLPRLEARQWRLTGLYISIVVASYMYMES